VICNISLNQIIFDVLMLNGIEKTEIKERKAIVKVRLDDLIIRLNWHIFLATE
jgi:hypothetical protein